MEEIYDQIVIGGGVIGSSIAYQLAKRGHKVLVVERKFVGSEASSAAAGMLGAQAEFKEESPLFQLALESRRLFPDLADELFEHSGIDIQLMHNGMFKLARSNERYQQLEQLAAFQSGVGEKASIISTDTLLKKEQNVTSDIAGAMYLPNESQVSAKHLTNAFIKSAIKFGAKVKEECSVENLVIENDQVVGVTTPKGKFYADKVVVATGAWSNSFSRYSDTDLHFYPVKGECLAVRPKSALINATIYDDSCYMVPKKDGRIIIGATSLPHQYNKSVSMEGMHQLMKSAMRIIPQLKEAKIEDVWAGIRPQTRDQLPYLGPISSVSGLFIAAGHYRNGILLSPITGKVMADMIEEKKVSLTYQRAFSTDREKQKVIGV
ncbi:glycine oxidase ThiO [Saliterribacillus persicus]|uniref:glycine oxidase n=1 Tax=Saliterribacillus persicus TaxID=930114 RepID=A0A368Y054_9BACI|nr:glycine oxidase ThiO [Saliterribacillus persicus]RCW73079.1 glycine oxidase [Saliterribacillus persicus]